MKIDTERAALPWYGRSLATFEDYYNDVSPPPCGTTRLDRAIDRFAADTMLEVRIMREHALKDIWPEEAMRLRRERLNPNNDPRILI